MAQLNRPVGRRIMQSCLGLSILFATAILLCQPLQAEAGAGASGRDRLLFTGAFRYTPPTAPNTDHIRQRIIAGPIAALQLAGDDDAEALPMVEPAAFVEPQSEDSVAPFRFFVQPANLPGASNPLTGRPSLGRISEDDRSIADEMREARLTIGRHEHREALPQLPEAHPHRNQRRSAALSRTKKKRVLRWRKYSHRATRPHRVRRTIARATSVSTVYADADPWARSAFTATN